ncbi:hypothetical protein Q1695_009270 [Nippostrongylus brasiliensis]|nr:hypothetical protein Q1695_009270 [Nippostrongylus brasiliensis]
MWLWFLTALSFALTFYISAIACGCGEREADKIAKRAAMEREFKRQQQLQQQQQQREKSAELLKKSNEDKTGSSDEGAPKPAALAQHPLPTAKSVKGQKVGDSVADDGYESCPDLTPEELQRIAAQK